MKIRKGEPGYIKAKKRSQLLLTILLFAVPLLIFFTGLYRFKTRNTLFTVIAVVGCLPACKSAVNCIMVWMRKTVSPQTQAALVEAAAGLVSAFDLTFTAYEKTTPVDCIVICGNTLVGYTSSEQADTAYLEKHIRQIMKQNGFRVQVKIMKQMDKFCSRIKSIRANQKELEKDISFTPNEQYPDLSRNELILHTLLAISL